MNIRTSLVVFLGVSGLFHAAFLSAMAVPENTLSAASAPPALVSQGNSFADMVQVSTAQMPETVQPAPTSTLTSSKVETVQSGVQLQADELNEMPADILATATAPSIATIAPVAPTRIETTQPAPLSSVPPQVIDALPDIQVSEATTSTLRPIQRPKNLGQTPQTPEQAPVTPQGTANQNTRQGQVAATQNTGQATQSGQGQQIDQAAVAAAREAAASYGSAVMRQISRTRRESTRSRGIAVVNFRVATSGQLSSVAIGQSSGDADLDRIALNHVRRAAPFPAPPTGAQTSFSIQFQGR